jgi:hypothetical protein
VAGYRNDRVVSFSAMSSVFENDAFFVAADGSFRSPSPADFTLQQVVWGTSGPTTTQTFTVQSVNCGASGQPFAQGNYSAFMLFDRSGSMSSNDPGGLSIEAGRVFADTMTGADQAAVAAFPLSSSNNRPYELTLYTQGFTSDKTATKNAIGSVGAPDGSTPLYDSILNALSYTATNATNSNKAVLAFTDGENTSGSGTDSDVIADSLRRRIPVFPIGLKDGSANVLARIARETNGGFFFASDAKQLAATYRSLAAILGGRAQICKVIIKTDLVGNTAVFNQQTGSSWVFTRNVRIDGVTVAYTFRQGFDVVSR